MKYRAFTLSALVALAVSSTTAQANDDLIAAIINGNVNIDARYRYEYVDQANRQLDAHASTLRTRLGYTTDEYKGFSGTLEFENITQIGDDNYNSTLNGKTNRPVVADPESTEINQAFLSYQGIEDTKIDLGRKVLEYDNFRFIGAVPWRQNIQTFDLVALDSEIIEDTRVRYAYLSRINRIFGEDSPMGRWDSDSHLINISNSSLPIGTVTAYGYLLDFENDSPMMSSQTYGVSLAGAPKISDETSLTYRLEYANQSNYGKNPVDYQADYYHAIGGLKENTWHTAVGYEILGTDKGKIAVSTPLARLHKANGWADVFLNTPANGLRDIYFDGSYKFSDGILDNVLVKGQYHEFASSTGKVDFGTEYGVWTKIPVSKNYYFEGKYANFQAEDSGTGLADTQRFIFGAGFKL